MTQSSLTLTLVVVSLAKMLVLDLHVCPIMAPCVSFALNTSFPLRKHKHQCWQKSLKWGITLKKKKIHQPLSHKASQSDCAHTHTHTPQTHTHTHIIAALLRNFTNCHILFSLCCNCLLPDAHQFILGESLFRFSHVRSHPDSLIAEGVFKGFFLSL